jgi:soluble lytic murein transglycosylase-like protein
MPRLGRALAAGAVLVAAVSLPAAGEQLMYIVKGDAIVFTNTPMQDAQPVPGFADWDGGDKSSQATLPATVYDPYIDRVAGENGLSPSLIKAVALVESGFDPHAVSRAGAQGLMQLMPQTAQEYGVTDAFDPLANLQAGARHLRKLLDQFDGDLTLALAAYNAGAGAVKRHDGVPNYAETVNYVRRVHEKLGREPRGLPAQAGKARAARPIRFKVLDDGSILFSN